MLIVGTSTPLTNVAIRTTGWITHNATILNEEEYI